MVFLDDVDSFVVVFVLALDIFAMHVPAMHRLLVERQAPNTAPLRDLSTGKIKKLRAVLMADGWESNPFAKQTCLQKLEELDIIPVLPRGDTHAVGDGCTPWPRGGAC